MRKTGWEVLAAREWGGSVIHRRVTVPTEKGFSWGMEVWAERKAALAAWF